MKGHLVVGCPRSGTTLVLSVVCPEWLDYDWSNSNEPRRLTSGIARKDLERLPQYLNEALAVSPFNVIKSPTLGIVFPYIDTSDCEVTVTFRDVRLVAASTLIHSHADNVSGRGGGFWRPYFDGRIARNPFGRVVQCWNLLYESILKHEGSMKVWSYGHWDDWDCPDMPSNRWTKGGSSRINDDLRDKGVNGFSNASFDISLWKECKIKHGISSKEEGEALMVQERLVSLYREKGFELKIL